MVRSSRHSTLGDKKLCSGDLSVEDIIQRCVPESAEASRSWFILVSGLALTVSFGFQCKLERQVQV